MSEPSATFLRIDVPATTLRELAADRLRRAIIAGQFAGGDRLVERALCERLGVSRSVVREAIRYLEAEGLVENLPRVGPVVARLDWPQARQIYDIRRLLEAEAAAECARRADPGLCARLRAAVAAMAAAAAGGRPQQLLDATATFYEAIFRGAGHEIAWEIVQRLHSRISRLRALTLSAADRTLAGHAHMERICAAICAGDAQAAVAAVHDHLRDAAEIARRRLAEGAAPG
jgi:DNA-binding GntR family transcriptional regulator